LRDQWSRGDARVLRQWLLLGPLPGNLDTDELESQGGEAMVHPAVADAGATKRWIAQPWGQEILDLSGALGSQQYRGSSASPETGYAFRLIKSEEDRDAVISLGCDTGVRVWVNGERVFESPTSTGFAFDRERIPVHLHQGDNRLLLKFEHHTGPWRFAARVLEPGTVVPGRDEIIPHVSSDRVGSVLQLRGESLHSHMDRPVQISVTAAGGRPAGNAVAARDQTVKIPTASWADGPYEIHFTTRTAWGRDVTTHIPWYKGSAPTAARQLLADAQTSSNDIRGAHVRMLADLVRDRVGSDLSQMPDDGWAIIHSPLLEYAEVKQAKNAGSVGVRPGGFVRLAYFDETDGSAQFCRAYLPTHYSASKRWPLMLELHGFNPANPVYVKWWSVDVRHNDIAEQHDVIFVEPYGRGNAQYMGIGEKDVLHCLAEAKRRFSVDDDRVYISGESMGGGGVWLIVTRHPDLFAAAAPVFGGWDFRVLHMLFDNPNATTLPERYAQEAQSSFAEAESLLNLPIYIQHGDADQTVNVDNSRHAARLLQRWGYDVRYREHPGRGHEDLNNRDEIVEWFLAHRRVSSPLHVRVRATDLDGATAYWVRVTALDSTIAVTRVDAEVIQPGEIRVDTQNVAAFTLSPPAALRNGARPVRVVWNGTEHVAPVSANGTVSLDSAHATSLEKHPGLSGGLSSLITTPFAVVIGTASTDPVMNRRCKEKAEGFATMWEGWQHQRPRIFTDEQLTPQDEQRYSLLLVGGPDANRVTRRMQSHLPLVVESDAITVDGRKFAVTDAVVQMIYPSPAARDRYVFVVAATSTAGMYFWNPGGLWNVPFGYPTIRMDWIIRDGRQVTLEPGLGSERRWVASGAFDRHWKRDDRMVFPGEEALRAHSPLHKPAPPDFRVSAVALNSYVGRYELNPGVTATIKQGSEGLVLETPDGFRTPLTPESETEFRVDYADGVLTFQRDSGGATTGATYNGDPGNLVLKKLPG